MRISVMELSETFVYSSASLWNRRFHYRNTTITHHHACATERKYHIHSSFARFIPNWVCACRKTEMCNHNEICRFKYSFDSILIALQCSNMPQVVWKSVNLIVKLKIEVYTGIFYGFLLHLYLWKYNQFMYQFLKENHISFRIALPRIFNGSF